MNLKLNLKQCAVLSALAVAASAALAADPTGVERTRAEVVAETLAARAAGTLAPAGERGPERSVASSDTSVRSRADLVAEVRSARASGQLIAAGEAAALPSPVPTGDAPLARGAVKAEVLAARAAGELVPAGEGPFAEGTTAHAARVASGRELVGLRAQRGTAPSQ